MGAPRQSGEVTYEMVEGRALLVSPNGEQLLTLNPVGTLVWAALDGRRDVAALADHLLPDLEGVTRDDLVTDVAAFLNELRALDLVID